MENNTKTHSNSNAANAACERCGSFDALEFAGKFLCEHCVALAGCGCAGHGAENSDS